MPGGTHPPFTPRFRDFEVGSCAIAASADNAVTFASPEARNFVVVVATVATFIMFDQASSGIANATGIPIPANTPVTFYGPIKSVHVQGGTGTLVVYAA